MECTFKRYHFSSSTNLYVPFINEADNNYTHAICSIPSSIA